MLIRPYRPGDEEGQARVFNASAAALPAFKPATAEEVARRYRTADPDHGSKLYGVDGDSDEIVAYAVFNPNGRVSYPWCLPGYEAARRPLLENLLEVMRDRGFTEAWAAYRADWAPVVDFFREQGFRATREMVNFLTDVGRLPRVPAPYGLTFGPLLRDDLPRLLEVGRGLFADDDPDRLGAYYWENPFLGPDPLFALRPVAGGPIEGAALVVVDARFADPTQIDPAAPCFRLGAMGTETERHKRVNGMVSCVFTDEAVGTALLAEAARRLDRAGLSHAAAQAPSDRPDLTAFYAWFFDRQGSFAILTRPLR
jgi:hypothetical protein